MTWSMLASSLPTIPTSPDPVTGHRPCTTVPIAGNQIDVTWPVNDRESDPMGHRG